jgi:hypothetical protein
MTAEASAKDRTSWFKRTQWDEHLQAYSLPLRALVSIARLFPWHGREKQAARRLWRIISRKEEEESNSIVH